MIKRVLVVDDEPEIVEEVLELLSDAGYDCMGVHSAKEAIDKIRSDTAIAVVVTDLKMPGMDGVEMVHTLNDTLSPDREVATIVVTGHAGTTEAIEALRMGALDFITKPISPEYLIHSVSRAVETIQLRRLDKQFNQHLQIQVLERTAEIQKLSTDLLEVNHDLHKVNEELEIAGRVKDEFLSMMSHELRTPLNAIIGFSQIMVAQNAEEEEPKEETFNQQVEDAGNKLLSIVETILELIDIRSGGLQLKKSDVDIDELLRHVVDAQSKEIKSKSINLIIESPKNCPTLYGDEKKLVQALANVLKNAIEFSNLDDQVGIAFDDTGGEIKFTIFDTGKGMSAGDIAKALEPFRQIDGSLNKSHYGLGLGLTLSRMICELHGGRLEIESAPDEGTKVTMILPAGEV